MNSTLNERWRRCVAAGHQMLTAYPLLERPAVLAVLTAVISVTLILSSFMVVFAGGPLQGADAPAAGRPHSAPMQALSGGRVPVVVVDPGHGGPDPGAASGGLVEADLNLEIAQKLKTQLEADGYKVILTRDSSAAPTATASSAWAGTQDDLQKRIDIANAANADLFISIHNNASDSTSQSGTEVWYSGDRAFGDKNKDLARLVQSGIVNNLKASGYDATNLGIKDDNTFGSWGGQPSYIYVIGPGSGPLAVDHTPTQMPGILGESGFITSPTDATALSQDKGLDAIARGYHDGIVAYFSQHPVNG